MDKYGAGIFLSIVGVLAFIIWISVYTWTSNLECTQKGGTYVVQNGICLSNSTIIK